MFLTNLMPFLAVAGTPINIITTIVNAIKEFMTGVGSTIPSFFDSVFVVAETGALTNAGTVLLSFFGIGLGFLFIRLTVGFLRR